MTLQDQQRPTIEQNFIFSAKTKTGEQFEFDTLLRIFITPTEDVRTSNPQEWDTELQDYEESEQQQDDMSLQDERSPTIEQNSNFSATTKGGQNVEFDTTVRFFISSTEDVAISVPDEWNKGLHADSIPYPVPDVDDGTFTDKSPGGVLDTDPHPAPDTDSNLTPDTEPSLAPDKESLSAPDTDINKKSDVEKHKMLSPKTGTVDCSVGEFIPDPCKAIDYVENSVSNILFNIFGSKKQ